LGISNEFKEYVFELLEPIGPLGVARFFGGVGISYGAVQFAMIMDSSLYFMVDDESRGKYQQAGMQCFSYLTKRGRVYVHRYYELPEEILTDAKELRMWADEANGTAGKVV